MTPCTLLKYLRQRSVSTYHESGDSGFSETSATLYRQHGVTSQKAMFCILCAAANSEFLVSTSVFCRLHLWGVNDFVTLQGL